MRRSGCSTSRRTCARKGFDVEIYDSTFGSRDELFRILETEPPATLGIYANLMTRANALAILATRRSRRLESDRGRTRSRRTIADRISRRRRSRRRAGEGELALEALLPRCMSLTARAGAPRLAQISTRSPGRTASASISTQYLRVWREHHGAGSVSRDHGARLPLSLPLVQPLDLRQDASPPLAPPPWPMRSSGFSIATSPSSSGWPTTSSPSTTAGSTSTPRK